MTSKKSIALIGFSLLLTGFSMAAPPLTSLHAKAVIRQEIKGKTTRTVNAETWIKGGKIRLLVGKMVDIMDGQNKYRFILDDKQKRYLTAPLPASMKARTMTQLMKIVYALPPNWTQKKIGAAKLLGHETVIYRLTPPGAKNPANSYRQIWITNDLGAPIPLKEIVKMSDISVTNVMTALEVNPNAVDALFAVPKGFHKIALPKVGIGPKGGVEYKVIPKAKK